MADIRINTTGNADSAVDTMGKTAKAISGVNDETEKLKKQAEAMDKANKYAWEQLGKYVAAAGAAVVAFGVASVKAFADSERIQKQLIRAAGEYAGALDEQAKALAKVYAVDDDVINQSHILLTQWAGVGAASREVEVAALNLSVALGVDLKTATEDLIRNVESGGSGLAKLGVHFTATGDKGKDLAAVVGAINKKFGGAAAADADSFTGQVHAAQIAFDDFTKTIGGSISTFLKQEGVVTKLTQAMRDLQGLFTPEADKHQNDDPVGMIQFWEQVASGNAKAWKDQAAGIEFTFEEAQQQLAQWRAKLRPNDFNVGNGSHGQDDLGDVKGETNKKMKEAEAAAQAHATNMIEIEKQLAEQRKKDYHDSEELDLQAEESDRKEAVHQLDMETERVKLAKKEGEDLLAVAMETAVKDIDIERKREEHFADMKHTADMKLIDEMYAQEKRWADAGIAIGEALVNSVSSELQKMMEGGDQDAGQAMANIIGDVLAVAGQVIGAAVGGMYGNAALGGAIGGAAGGLAGAGVKAIGRAGAKKHDGGAIGDEAPRYHDGGLLPDERHIIAQTGEFMLSRQHVANMGGEEGVKAAASGGGGRFNFTIQTIDAIGTRQFFENDGGRGFFNALRTGRGSLLPAFGGS